MAYLSEYQYYANGGNPPADENWGSYQYVSLFDIVNNFELMYSGNHSLVNNEPRHKVLFHAKRAIQELNYDAFKEIKVLELDVAEGLRFVLPSDYVNWVRISMYKDGVLRPLNENVQAISATSYEQDSSGAIIFDIDGNIVSKESNIDAERIAGTKKSLYLDGRLGYDIDGEWFFSYPVGARYGLNTSTANINPTFRIDKKSGVINFSSSIGSNSVVIEYISDGMEGGDNSKISVNKMFEKYIYAQIEYDILSSKVGVQEYIVRRVQKKRRALLSNAKIRMSDIHPGKLLMAIRGGDKVLK